MPQLLQINYQLHVSPEEFLHNAAPVAQAISQIPGLQWKIWLANEDERTGGGIYLFEDKTSLEKFLNGPIIEMLRKHPDVGEVSIKQFEVATEATDITRGPIHK